jgi:heme/copper-type cytochrome/quinol oxidase subunit 2
MKMSQFILSNMPNGRHPLSWLVFVLLLIIMIPILILMVILIPVLLIFNLIKMRFFPNKKPKTFITPFGFAAYSQVNRSVVNYPWHDIVKVEVWNEDGKTFPVLHMQNGEPVKLMDVSVEQIKALCAQHGITFHEDVVIVQDA